MNSFGLSLCRINFLIATMFTTKDLSTYVVLSGDIIWVESISMQFIIQPSLFEE